MPKKRRPFGSTSVNRDARKCSSKPVYVSVDTDLEQRLSRLCGVSIQTVRDALEQGEKHGVIEHVGRGQYRLTMPPEQCG